MAMCRVLRLGVGVVSVALGLALGCKPPESPPARPAAADAPPNGKALMGGKPQEGSGGTANAMPDFAKAIAVTVGMADPLGAQTKEATLRAQVRLEPGFHAYAPGEQTGRPLAFEVTSAGWVLQAQDIPKGEEKDLGDLGRSRVLTGEVNASATVQRAGAGGGALEGRFHYQVCSETACDRPRSTAFRF